MAGVLVQKFNNSGDLKYYENITTVLSIEAGCHRKSTGI
jgi:hypothetical protein